MKHLVYLFSLLALVAMTSCGTVYHPVYYDYDVAYKVHYPDTAITVHQTLGNVTEVSFGSASGSNYIFAWNSFPEGPMVKGDYIYSSTAPYEILHSERTQLPIVEIKESNQKHIYSVVPITEECAMRLFNNKKCAIGYDGQKYKMCYEYSKKKNIQKWFYPLNPKWSKHITSSDIIK